MSDYKVGKEVLSYCSKCKLNLAHIIVSMKDAGTLGKVECKTCKSTHAYKDPSIMLRKSKKIPGAVAKKSPSTAGQTWMDQMGKTTKKSRAYSIREKFSIGDIIDHPKFGPGIVQENKDDKIEVLFRHDIKLLVHNK
jgi:hypothetical protein